jgi:hypothetical protein
MSWLKKLPMENKDKGAITEKNTCCSFDFEDAFMLN